MDSEKNAPPEPDTEPAEEQPVTPTPPESDDEEADES